MKKKKIRKRRMVIYLYRTRQRCKGYPVRQSGVRNGLA